MKAVKSQAPAQEPTTSNQAQLTIEDIRKLKAPFPKDRLGVKVQSFSKDRSRAMLVLYLQHTDVQDRIEEVDPAWTSEVTNEERIGDTIYVRTCLTIKGVSRENVGEGGDPKAAYSDALKRAAMLFGIGRYLYDSPTVWSEYDEGRDRYRTWTVDDFERAMKPADARAMAEAKATAEAKSPAAAKGLTTGATAPKKAEGASTAPRSREELNRVLMNLYRPFLTQFPQTQFPQLLQTRYQVAETRLMTVEQLEDLVQHLEEKLRSVA